MPPLFRDPVRLRNVAFRLIRDLYRLPTTAEDDLDAVVRRVRTIHTGLNAEREFFALVSWLGRCAAVHAIEDLPSPVADFQKELRPSDFLAVCSFEDRRLPVLIE